MEPTRPNVYWWEKKDDQLAESIFGILKFIDKHQGQRRQANLRNMRLYGNMDVLGMSANNYTRSEGSFNVDRLTVNIIQSCCDTVTQKIAKNKVKPMFMTMGGDASLKRKAKNLDKFIQGLFYQLKIYQTTPTIFRDATIFGTAALHIFRDEDEIKTERVFIDELKSLDNESIYGKPRSIYRVKYIGREVLTRMYPKFANQISLAKKAENPGTPENSEVSEMIEVGEAWHLRSGKEAKDGKHAICIENATLFSEQYDRDYFPFVFLRWSERLLGFFGQGLAELNKILRIVERAFNLCVPQMMVQNGSKVVLQHLNNMLGAIIKHDGVAPQWTTPAPVNPQYFQYIQALVDKAYEQSGISQLSAQAKKPDGLDSGKALREFNDIESERFILVGMAWEDFHMEISSRLIDLSKEIAEKNPSFSVIARNNKVIEKIKWKDVDMKADQYQLQVFPTSFLSSTPSGKFKDVQELVQSGFIPKEIASKLMDFPDLEWAMGLINAGMDDIDRMIENLLEKGQYQPPEPYQNLQMGIPYMQSAYLRAKDDGVDEERLELMRRWMSEADSLLNPPPPPAPPGAGMDGPPGAPPPGGALPGMSPQAVPQAPPVSDLLPQGAQ
jgi:hypothetical protein